MPMDMKKELIRIRRQIHMYPELGNREVKTTRFIESVLKKHGVRTKKITKTGMVGILTGKPHSRCIALRADIDALPVQEQTGKPYASRYKGIMHACGHDANTTMLLGAAIKLSKLRQTFKGTVKFIFQPNEEYSNGAAGMIKAGVLRNPKVDAIVGIHVHAQLPSGVLGIKYDEAMAAVDRFEIEIYGGGGHAAYPHLGKDALLCACELVTSMQAIVARELDPTSTAVLSVCAFNGGMRYNVLADRVVLKGTVRTFKDALRRKIIARIRKHVASAAGRYGLKHRIQYDIMGHPLINNRLMIERAVTSGKKVARIAYLKKPSMGGEDFAEYLRYVKGCFLYIGSADRRKVYPWHHPKFDIDEKILPVGAGVLAQVALDYLS